MDAPPIADLSLIYADEGTVLGAFRNVVVQLRRGALSYALLDRFALRARTIQRMYPAGIGVLAVLEPDAPFVDAELRARQTAVMREIAARGRMCNAIVLPGNDISTNLRRASITSTRTIANFADQRIEATVPPAARWLAQTLAAPDPRELALALERCVDSLRERYHARPAAG